MTESTPRHSVSVAAAIVNEQGKVLAIRRHDNGQWEPPGGILELDETIDEGLMREVREETGLRVVPEHLTGVYKNMKRGIIALVFRCRVVSGQPHASPEATEIRWLSPPEVADLMSEAYAVRLLDALRADGPAIRAHDGLMILQSAGPI
jgi:8-oxo-dGTP diphosphatase